MHLRTGDIFLDRYEVSHPIGRGAFGQVFRAWDQRVNRDVAIKFLIIEDDVAQARFEVEAKVVASLSEPATVRLFDYGVFENTPYMVMEFVSGRTMRKIIDWRGPFEVEATLDILLQILRSLREAHGLGVVHRDLKPSNIVLSQPDPSRSNYTAKILDFGVAKVLTKGGMITHPGRLTVQGSTVGTLRYMPIEQMRGGDVKPASDLFSLGVVAYEMLTGKHPYWDDNQSGVPTDLLDPEPFTLPDDVEAPMGLKAVVHRLIQKNAADRYQDAGAVIDHLESFVTLSAEGEHDTIEMEREPAFLASVTEEGWDEDRSYVSLVARSGDDNGSRNENE